MVSSRWSAMARLLQTAVIVGLAWSVAPSAAGAADNQAPSAQTAPTREEWRAAMDALPTPQEGCFTATYPNVEWRQTVCVNAPQRPYPPARGSRTDLVGNGNDVSGYVANHISSAIGSFPKVTGVTSEQGYVGGNPPLVANTYSLQLNTQTFSTKACNGEADCEGWQQFVYSSSEGVAFMQYWLIGYIGSTNSSCPANWYTYYPDCYTNSAATTVNGGQPILISQLVDLKMKATASKVNDTLTFNDGKVARSVSAKDSKVDLASAWQAAEFNIVGDCCATEAFFNTGASLEVDTVIDHGNTSAPSCLGEGFTGETNSLYFVSTGTHSVKGSPPAIYFTEASPTTSTTACSSATSVGK